MEQLELQYNPPIELDIDGHIDARGIRYIGKASKQFSSGKWKCLANVNGQLCLVEIKITEKRNA